MTSATPDGPARLPARGTPVDDLLAHIDAAREGDLDWKGGKAFSLVYNSGDEEHERLLHAVADRYLHENALNPFRYPSLLQMELDLVAIAGDLFHTGDDCGAVTAGGSISIFCAVQVVREHARKEMGIAEPEVVAPITAHPAFAKACDLLDIGLRTVPVEADGRVDPARMAEAITDRTAVLVASAANYPFGVIDPVPEVAALAAERGLLCHVDACLGGFFLPFWERLGHEVTPWDFRVEGVTSLSADIHKYGYAFKGASMVMYRSRDLLRNQHFWYDAWPGGMYASSTPAGTRPAPPIAGAWAALHHLGEEGFLRLTKQVEEGNDAFRAAIAACDGAVVTPEPDIAVFQLTTPGRSHDAVGDRMDARGWNLDRQQGGLHVMLSPYHVQVAERFGEDLAASVAEVPVTDDAPTESTVSTYGGIAE